MRRATVVHLDTWADLIYLNEPDNWEEITIPTGLNQDNWYINHKGIGVLIPVDGQPVLIPYGHKDVIKESLEKNYFKPVEVE